MAQVIDNDGHWDTAGDTVVQLGDIVDRGPHGHAIYEYFGILQQEARAAGGEFHHLLGNHEIFALRGDVRFVHPEMFEAFGGQLGYLDAWSPTGSYGKLLTNLDTVLIRNQTLMVHAGLMPAIAKAVAGDVEKINENVRQMIQQKNWDLNPWLGVEGPVWTRTQIHEAQAGKCNSVTETLRIINDHELRQGRPPVIRIVVGHTIQLNGLVSVLCDGSLIAVDVGMSQYMQGGGWLAFVEVRLSTSGSVEAFVRYPPYRDKKHTLSHPRRPKLLTLKQFVKAHAKPIRNDALVLIALVLLILLWRMSAHRTTIMAGILRYTNRHKASNPKAVV
jgi:hypothetical protein